ncbi:MAG: hypothetical protein ABJB86_24860, partial [Bacteroidota bacterium]
MKKKYTQSKIRLIAFTLFFIAGYCNDAYSQNFAWAKRMGGFSIDVNLATAVTADASGNVYSTG